MPIDSLHILATNATRLSDPGEFFRSSRLIIAEQMTADAVLFFYHDDSRECLVAPFLYNVMPHASIEEIVITYQEAMIKDLLIARKPHVAQEAEKRLLAGMLCELFLPVVTPDQVLGCLYLGRRGLPMWSAAEIQLAELFSCFLVSPLQRIHWEEHSRRTHELLNAFREQYLYILDTIPLPAMVADPGRDVIEEANLSFLHWLQYSRPMLFNSRLSQVCMTMPMLQQQENVWPPQATEVRLRDGRGRLRESRAFVSPSVDSYKERKILIFMPEEMAGISAAVSGEGENYLYSLSHDLKTPIQSLKSYITLLREEYGALIPTTALTYVERMYGNLEQMESLITNLLDLSRIGKIEMRMETAGASEILKNALDTLSGLLERRAVNLIIDANLPMIFCDSIQMTRVFTNLITNALRFTAGVAMPSIEIGCNEQKQEYEFYVKDNGPGIPESVQPQVFNLFFSHNGTAKQQSTGIGLTIVKRIVERHHGRIWVESKEGEGAIFKFTIPMQPQANSKQEH